MQQKLHGVVNHLFAEQHKPQNKAVLQYHTVGKLPHRGKIAELYVRIRKRGLESLGFQPSLLS